jgi:aerobic C4-dicarboxylate transport protein
MIAKRKPRREKSTVGLVIPTGYSFNLDGTSIYLTMAAVFVAQATNTQMTTQQLTLLGVLLLTSRCRKASPAAVHRAGAHAVCGREVVAGLALILGIDRHVGSPRADQSDRQWCGNSGRKKWCGELDMDRMQKVLNNETPDEAEEPEKILDAAEGHMAAKSH